MSQIWAVGHVPPDTDSVCAPLVYAMLMNKVGLDVKAVIGKPINRETKYILDRLQIAAPEEVASIPPGTKVVVLDTNNPEEMIAGYQEAEIVEIIDHHKLAGLTTPAPLKITMEPVACTTTLVYKLALQNGAEIDDKAAGLMLAAIISDTLKFTSPTTTDQDRQVAEELAKISGLNIDEFAQGMFAAKSNLEGMSTEEILLSDHKNYELGGDKYKVAVLETADPTQALNMESVLRPAMTEIVKAENLKGMFFFVVDIINSNSTLLVTSSANEASLAEKAFGAQFVDGKMSLPGVVSRKKQMVPPLEKAAM